MLILFVHCIFIFSGWHNRLNSRVGPLGNIGLYSLAPLLHKEASLVTIQMKLIGEGKLKCYQRKSASSMQAKIFVIWEQYKDGDLSVSKLLKRTSRIYSPSPAPSDE